MASVEGHPGYRATHIFSRTLASRPIRSVTASRLWPSAKKKEQTKKKKNSKKSRRISLARAAGASPLQPSLARLLLDETKKTQKRNKKETKPLRHKKEIVRKNSSFAARAPLARYRSRGFPLEEAQPHCRHNANLSCALTRQQHEHIKNELHHCKIRRQLHEPARVHRKSNERC